MAEGVPHPQVVGNNAYNDLRRVEWSKEGKEIYASDYKRAIFSFKVCDDGAKLFNPS